MRPLSELQHLPKTSGIYLIRNEQTGKVYVGSSQNIRTRCYQHLRLLEKGRHHGKHLQHAWNSYGRGAFTFHAVEFCPETELINRERYWMQVHQTQDPDQGYNTYGAEPTGRGYTQTPEHVEKRIAPLRGREAPQHVKDAVAAANKSRAWTPEQREAARSRLLAGKQAIPAQEFSERLSKSMQGRTMSEEQRDHLSNVMTGRKWRDTPEGELRAQTVSEKLRGSKRSEDVRKGMSAAQKKRWAGSPEARKAAHERALKCWESRRANAKAAPSSTTPEESTPPD